PSCGSGHGPFPDVHGTHSFCDDIEWLVAEEISGGFADGTFRPTAPVTRQSMAAFLYRVAGRPPSSPPASTTFTDVGTTHPFRTEIEWLASEGIADGYDDGTFGSSSRVTRQSTAAFLHRFADVSGFVPP